MIMRDAYFPMLETIPSEDYIIATYLAEIPNGLTGLEYAIELAIDQTTGTWTKVKEETEEVKRNHRARVIGVYEIPKDADVVHKCIIQLAFPYANFAFSLSQMFVTMLGNNSSMGFIKLVDLTFPKKYLEHYPGPKYGVEGFREITGVKERPLLCNMIKPCTGIPPKVGAELAYLAAVGGADMVKDDELMSDCEFSTFHERTRVFIDKLKQADDIKGEKTLYMVNITDRPDKMLDNALWAVENGANGLMINYMTCGFDAVRMVTENKDVTLPVFGHCAMSGALSAGAYNGIDVSLLVGKIPRMIGLDSVLVYYPEGRFLLTEDKYAQIVNMQQDDFYHLKRVMPFPGGSIHPGTVKKTLDITGTDCIVSAGGGIHGHPDGSTAGAIAMRQAIDLAMDPNLDPNDYAEYQKAIEFWGSSK